MTSGATEEPNGQPFGDESCMRADRRAGESVPRWEVETVADGAGPGRQGRMGPPKTELGKSGVHRGVEAA